MATSNAGSRYWCPLTPIQVSELFADTDFAWWISGGFAIDAHLGYATRPHDDIDIGVLRSQTDLAWNAVAQLDPHLATPSADLVSWDGTAPPEDVNDIWIKHPEHDAWGVQLMLNAGTTDAWSHRRDPSITMPTDEAIVQRNNIPYLAAHLQLLFKSKNLRQKDDGDAALVIPTLTAAERAWLSSHLPTDHKWQGSLII